MDSATARRLSQLNRDFYRERAAEFSSTRSSPWPGWTRLLPHLEATLGAVPRGRILDLGRGNGRFASWLRSSLDRTSVLVVGADRSLRLLREPVAAERRVCLDLEDGLDPLRSGASTSWRCSACSTTCPPSAGVLPCSAPPGIASAPADDSQSPFGDATPRASPTVPSRRRLAFPALCPSGSAPGISCCPGAQAESLGRCAIAISSTTRSGCSCLAPAASRALESFDADGPSGISNSYFVGRRR